MDRKPQLRDLVIRLKVVAPLLSFVGMDHHVFFAMLRVSSESAMEWAYEDDINTAQQLRALLKERCQKLNLFKI